LTQLITPSCPAFVRSILRLALFLVVTLTTVTGFAEAPTPAFQRDFLQAEGVQSAPLLYQLPPLGTSDASSLLEIELVGGSGTAVRQTIELPAYLPQGASVAVLGDHPAELERLRELNTSTPGSIAVRVWLGGKLLDARSLDEVEEATRRSASRDLPVVGITRKIDVPVDGGLRRITAQAYEDGRDPLCVQQCDDERYFCYTEICDPRGSCEFCEDNYDSCVLSCPICPTTREYTTVTVLSLSYFNSFRCFQGFGTFGEGRVHQLISRTLRSRRWREVRQCDGSTTTTLLSTNTWSETCWDQYNTYCSPWEHNYTPYPTCFPY
jgi:hypothetical protein